MGYAINLGNHGWFYCESHIHAWNMAWGDLLKERFGLAQSMVRWYVEVPNFVGLHMLIRVLSILCFMCKCTGYYVAMMVAL